MKQVNEIIVRSRNYEVTKKLENEGQEEVVMNTQEIILENLKEVAQMIADNFGRHCEVVVHDLRDLEHSLIYVAGEITGRSIGAPITDLVVKTLYREGDAAKDLVAYKTVAKDGRVLKSSTAFIRDEKGKIFATLCLNYDLTDFQNFAVFLQEFTQFHGINNEEKQETFATTVQETIEALVNQTIAKMGKQPVTMAMEDKVRFVGILEGKGAFLIKGSVDYIATILGVSKFTVYNYLTKVRSIVELSTP